MLDYITQAGLAGLTLFILWAGIKENPLWVPGTAFRLCEQRSQRWERLALRGTSLSAAAAEALERKREEEEP